MDISTYYELSELIGNYIKKLFIKIKNTLFLLLMEHMHNLKNQLMKII